MRIQKITHNNKLWALLIRKGLNPPNTTFYTPENNSLQLGIISHPKGYFEQEHEHKKIKKIIYDVQQFIYLTKGKVAIYFYKKNGRRLKIVKKVILRKGDSILIISGIHSLKAISAFQGLTTKQGPFLGVDKDKLLIRSIKK